MASQPRRFAGALWIESLGLTPSTDITMLDQNLTIGGIDLLADLVEQHTQGWATSLEDPTQVRERAIALGATR